MKEWDHDIDNLFRRAADEYPLNTGTGEWHKVEVKLYKRGAPPEISGKSPHVRNIVVAAVFILFFALGLQELLTHNNVQSVSTNNENNAVTQSKQSSAEKPKAENHSNGTDIPKTFSNIAAVPQKQVTKISQSAAVGVGHHLLDKDVHSTLQTDIVIALSKTPDSKESINHSIDVLSEAAFFKMIPADEGVIIEKKKPLVSIPSSLMGSSQPGLIYHNNSLLKLKTSFSKQKQELVRVNVQLSPFFKRFYFGITGSPEFSKVKNSGYTTPGSSFALVAGYQLNDHFSIETGARRNNLFFKSIGDLYNRSNLKNINELAIISTLNGYNRETELPFLVRFNAESFSKNSLSFAAGTSLTISHQENYNYRLYQTERSINAAREYNKSPARLFNNMFISAAFERDLGFQTTLRIEPYYKVPLRGMGAGELPISGMGIHTGFIKYFK